MKGGTRQPFALSSSFGGRRSLSSNLEEAISCGFNFIEDDQFRRVPTAVLL